MKETFESYLQTLKRKRRIKYPNALKYKVDNSHIIIQTTGDDDFYLTFKKLLKLNDVEKKQYRNNNSKSTILLEREHSQLCIWVNYIRLSLSAMECLHNSFDELESLNHRH